MSEPHYRDDSPLNVNLAGSAVPFGSGQLLKTVAVPGTAERISATDLMVKKFLVLGQKSPRVANTTDKNVFLGVTGDAAAQPDIIGPGDRYDYSSDGIGLFNLKNFWLDAEQAGDGVVIAYWT